MLTCSYGYNHLHVYIHHGCKITTSIICAQISNVTTYMCFEDLFGNLAEHIQVLHSKICGYDLVPLFQFP